MGPMGPRRGVIRREVHDVLIGRYRYDRVQDVVNVSLLGLLIVVILVLFLIGALPRWNHSREWGWAPGSLLGTLLIVIVVIALIGMI